MDDVQVTVLAERLEAIAKRIDEGFRAVERSLDEISKGHARLEDRVRCLEVEGAGRRVATLEEDVDRIQSRLVTVDAERAAEKVKLQWLVGVIGALAAIGGGVVSRLLG